MHRAAGTRHALAARARANPRERARTYVRRWLRTYLRRVRWYMEVAPKFPRGVIRLSVASLPLPPSLSHFRQSSGAVSVFLLLAVPSTPSFCEQPFRVLASADLVDVYPASDGDSCSPARTLEQSPRGIIKIAVHGDGANGFRDITASTLCTRDITDTEEGGRESLIERRIFHYKLYTVA